MKTDRRTPQEAVLPPTAKMTMTDLAPSADLFMYATSTEVCVSAPVTTVSICPFTKEPEEWVCPDCENLIAKSLWDEIWDSDGYENHCRFCHPEEYEE